MNAYLFIVFLTFFSLPALLPSVASSGQEKTAQAIQSEWPELDFTSAYDSFEKKDFARAAQEIRKGADFLKTAAERSSGKIRGDLSRSYNEIVKLSTDIENGSVKSSSRLKKEFSRAHQSLSEYYNERLGNSWLKRDTDNAGRELKSAVSNLEHSLSWAGNETKQKTKTVINDARSLGERLINKVALTAKEVETEIQKVGVEINELKAKVSEGQEQNGNDSRGLKK